MKPGPAGRIDMVQREPDLRATGSAMAEAVAWETVRRAAGGDDLARRRLVEATLDDLWALAMRLTRRPNDADDVVQETYARALASLDGLTPRGRFEGFLARIATNLVLERWRQRRPTVDVDRTVLTDKAMEPWRTVASQEDERRRLAAIWEAAHRLDPKLRATLLLHYAQGLSVEAIAGILDAPSGTVKTWLYRARGEVRRTALALLNGRATGQPAAKGES